jgi:hypothetical protein
LQSVWLQFTILERLLKINPLKIVASGEFVEIDNATYYIGTFGYSRDEAKMACESMNMTMISFEGDEQKWRSINIWIRDNGTLLKLFLNPITKFSCV